MNTGDGKGGRPPVGRRAHGEGSIYQRSDGRWCATVDLGWTDGKRRRKSAYGPTQAAVRARLVALRAQTDAGLPAPDDRLTVGGLLDIGLGTTSLERWGFTYWKPTREDMRNTLLPLRLPRLHNT